MKILTFTTLFPNAAKPHHGIFTQTSLNDVLRTGKVEAVVVAPTPWFPFKSERFGAYGTFARVPAEETRIGTRVLHPRYPVVPKIGMNIAPLALARGVRATIRRLLDEGFDFDAIDAHYFYPDGVAAALLGREFGKPVVISALGTDINLIARFGWPRRMIRWAGTRAAAVITVSEALRGEMIKLGVDGDKVVTLRNGVDLALFHPQERQPLRARLGITGFTVLSVGNLIELKGHHRIIEALTRLPDVRLLIAGSGPDEQSLRRLAQTLGVADRVRLLGPLPQAQLGDYYAASDALVLASSREGWANVLLESMACGTPAIGSRVGGTPEVIARPEAGLLMDSNTPEGIADTISALRAAGVDRHATRAYAEGFSWDETTRRKIELLRQATRRG